jgi:hypothetical protein
MNLPRKVIIPRPNWRRLREFWRSIEAKINRMLKVFALQKELLGGM